MENTGSLSAMAPPLTSFEIQKTQMADAAGSDSCPAIYICDRGYASCNNYACVIENGQYFLIRCTDAETEKLGNSPSYRN